MKGLQTENMYRIAVGRNDLGPSRHCGEKLYITIQHVAFVCGHGTSSLSVRQVHITYDDRTLPLITAYVQTSSDQHLNDEHVRV